MAKKQKQEEPKNDTFDPNDFLGDDEIETPGASADFGDELDSADNPDGGDPDQYSGQDTDTLGGDYDPDGEQEASGEEGDDPESQEAESEGDQALEEGEQETGEGEGEQGESEEDDSSQAEADAQKETQPKRHMIPKRRLDSEVAKRRQLEKQLKDMQKQQQQVQQQLQEKEKIPEEDIQQWLQQSADKALNGETEESAKLQQKAFDAMSQNRGQGQQSQQEQIDPNDVIQQVEERVEMKSKVKEVFEAYPSLDPNSDSFDEDLNEEVLELNDFYTNKGYSPAVATDKAVSVLASQHGLEAANAQPAQPAKKPARDTKPKVEQKMDAARRQPPEPSNRRGNKSSSEDTVDVNNLSDEELMALPENVRARLRGD